MTVLLQAQIPATEDAQAAYQAAVDRMAALETNVAGAQAELAALKQRRADVQTAQVVAQHAAKAEIDRYAAGLLVGNPTQPGAAFTDADATQRATAQAIGQLDQSITDLQANLTRLYAQTNNAQQQLYSADFEATLAQYRDALETSGALILAAELRAKASHSGVVLSMSDGLLNPAGAIGAYRLTAA